MTNVLSCSKREIPTIELSNTSTTRWRSAFPGESCQENARVKLSSLLYFFFLFSDLSTDNLRFLSSRQALADLAHFRTTIAEARGLTNAKWVAFGGSYPGSLAAWFRLKYPHMVHAAVASSAPVLATVNFPGIKTVCTSLMLKPRGRQLHLVKHICTSFKWASGKPDGFFQDQVIAVWICIAVIFRGSKVNNNSVCAFWANAGIWSRNIFSLPQTATHIII